MIIKRATQKRAVYKKIILFKNNSRFRIKSLRWFLFLVCMTFLMMSCIYLGMMLHKKGMAGELHDQLKWYAIPNYLSSLAVKPERVDIDIKFKNFQKIAYKRQEALRLGQLYASPDDWVPAKLRYKGKTYSIKMRLKGDTSKHWKQETGWSYKIKIRNGDVLFGMRSFAIQSPRTRDGVNEWLLHKFLGANGLIALRFDFIEVTINGKRQPIYAFEENFEKALIENNRRREGPILKFDMATSAVPFETKKVSEGEHAKLFKAARNRLELFRQGKLTVSEVFDIEQLARFFAVIDLWGHHHATLLDNMKLYYNPVTSLIEPVGYDNQTISPLSEEGLLGAMRKVGAAERISVPFANRWRNSSWYDALFNDPQFFEQYVKELERISDRKLLEDFFGKIVKELNEKLKILYRSYPWYQFNEKPILYENQRYIASALTPPQTLVVAFVKNYSDDTKTLLIEAGNLYTLPLEFLNLTLNDGLTILPLHKTFMQSRTEKGKMDYATAEFVLPPNFKWPAPSDLNLKVSFKIPGANKTEQIAVYPWKRFDEDFLTQDFFRQNANPKDFDFLIVDEENKTISFKQGDWNLKRDLLLPKGYTVIAHEGTRINLSNRSVILSYSPVVFLGSEEMPVIISSKDTDGQGMAVINGEYESVLKYVHFENLSNPSRATWQLSGAVTFYQSPVNLSHCRFSRNHSEDSLNIIQSNFKIEYSVFENSSADAFDGDFVEGVITESSFLKSGNDAVDVSGSTVEIKNLVVNQAGDKGVSAGEASRVTIDEANIARSKTAFASKDMSHCFIGDVAISDCEIGLAVYQKKPEFGPSAMVVENINMKNVREPFWLMEKSKLRMNDKEMAPNQEKMPEYPSKAAAQ